MARIGGHAGDAGGGERETLEEVVVEASFAARDEVLLVLGEDCVLALEQERGDALERAILGVG